MCWLNIHGSYENLLSTTTALGATAILSPRGENTVDRTWIWVACNYLLGVRASLPTMLRLCCDSSALLLFSTTAADRTSAQILPSAHLAMDGAFLDDAISDFQTLTLDWDTSMLCWDLHLTAALLLAVAT